jgi:hypothetical protein
MFPFFFQKNKQIKIKKSFLFLLTELFIYDTIIVCLLFILSMENTMEFYYGYITTDYPFLSQGVCYDK